jgi:hypothetical protein
MRVRAIRFALSGVVAAAATLAVVAAARAGELIVVEARGVALHAGQVLDDTQKLTLTEGQRVTLIAANGNTLKLRGPYDQAPAAAAGTEADLGTALAALLVQKQTRTSEVGVTRAGPEAGELPDPWILDITRPGNLCIRDGVPIVVWRPDAKRTANLQIISTDKSWKVVSDWPGGVDRLTLPQRFPAKNRATYLVELGAAKAAVTLHTIPTAVDQDRMRAGWMIEKGCAEQANALIKTLQ